MAETELRAKEIERKSPTVVVGEVKIPRPRPGLRPGLRWMVIGLVYLATFINTTWVYSKISVMSQLATL